CATFTTVVSFDYW
nr:immunoglobulin heavy chain junction region [Mus musculus]